MALLYIEPGVTHLINEDKAIEDMLKKPFYADKGSKIALEDFITIHWAFNIPDHLDFSEGKIFGDLRGFYNDPSHP